jgi:aryl sulfotransferase
MNGIWWLASYPKSGNTWCRAFLVNLLADQDQPANINRLRTGSIAGARVWLDDVLGFDTADLTPDEIDALRPEVYRWSEDGGPPYHKIHDAYTVDAHGQPLVPLERTLGAVYIVRNPLDVVASFAVHMGSTIDEAIEHMGDPTFSLGRKPGGLFHQTRQQLLSWSGHVASWMDAPGLVREVVRYEDMMSDPETTFTKVAAFLDLPTDASRIDKAIAFASFEELSSQEVAHGFGEVSAIAERFFRRGVAGGWRDELTQAQAERVVQDHGAVMRRLGYLDASGAPTS